MMINSHDSILHGKRTAAILRVLGRAELFPVLFNRCHSGTGQVAWWRLPAVPAKVAGHWQLPNGELHLDQAFQMVNGKLTAAGQTGQLDDGKLAGNRISFAVGDAQYIGHVSGHARSSPAK